MGLRDYYRQFEAMPQQEISERLRAEAEERRRTALARVDPLDLSLTTWPDVPPHSVVNAITYVARRGLNRYLDPHGSELRGELAHRHGVPPERVVAGDGSAQLMHAAAQAMLEPGDELVTPWPGYPLHPLIARAAHAQAVPVPGFGADALLQAVNERTRIVAIANPNDPTGELMGVDEIQALLEALPERVVVLLDEALRDYVSAEDPDATLALLDAHPRLLIFRTFSKAWGLAGLRCGYAVGGAGAEPLLAQLEPDLGLGELAQAGALEALRHHAGLPASRAEVVRRNRDRLTDAARGLGLTVTPSQANVVWIGRPGTTGAELSGRLHRAGITVRDGAPLGDASRVRITVPVTDHTLDRLIRALELAR